MLNRIIRMAAFACTLSFLAGCTARLDPAESNSNPISFNAGSALLRDDATKAAYPAGTSFGVFAYKGTWNNNLTPGFMFNVEVAYDGTSYTYSPVRFWPAVTEKLNFWAYSPYSASPVLYKAGTTTAFSSTTKGIPDIQYTADGQTDFLVSDIVKNQTKNSNSGLVVMPFNHALSKVDVTVNKDDPTSKYTVKLKAVRFDGIYSTGILSNNAGWSNLSDNGDYTVFSGNQTLSTTPSFALDGVMLIPQNFTSDDTKLHVEFSITPAGGGTERTSACEVPLSEVFEDASSRWDKNKHYTLTLTVTPDDPIAFSVEWSDWGTVYNWHITS